LQNAAFELESVLRLSKQVTLQEETTNTFSSAMSLSLIGQRFHACQGAVRSLLIQQKGVTCQR